MSEWRVLLGDVRETLATLPAESVQTCVTSPPYFGLRDYGMAGQLGLEPTPTAYIANLVRVFRQVRRVLKDDATCWINLGDSYKDKQLLGLPWRVALSLQDDGWFLRTDIIWNKPNPMPESVTDRPTKAHEYIFLLTKSARYYYDAAAIRDDGAGRTDLGNMNARGRLDVGGPWAHTEKADDGRNKRSVWTVPTQPYPEAHFATYPEDLIEPCILAGSRVGDTVLDPFTGSGTTGAVAVRHQRSFVGCELNPAYLQLARTRIGRVAPMFAKEVA